MYPAPSARKYCRYLRGHSLRTTKYPPTKFPAAATRPSPAASAVRNVTSCPIASGTGFSLCKPNPPCCSTQSQICSLPLLLCETFAFGGCPDRVGAALRYLYPFSLLPSSPRMPKKNHIPFLHHVLFPLQPDRKSVV